MPQEGRSRRSASQELEAVFEAALAIALGVLASDGEAEVDPEPPRALVEVLLAPLTHPVSPRASAVGEVAFTLCGIALWQGYLPDLGQRVPGDRAASEALARVLKAHNVPATRGALQSSTYRGGYLAAQARDAALRAFVRWTETDGRSLADIGGLFARLALGFAGCAHGFPDPPRFVTERFTFSRTRMLLEALCAHGSGGAYEQYLVASLLGQEYEANGLQWRVETKPAGASDLASRAVGDVQVRHHQRLIYALEVSATDWQGKLAQALDTLRRTALVQATVVADATGLTGERLEALIGAVGDADVAVVGLDAFFDVVSSRLGPAERVRAIANLFDSLVRWERDRPDLAWALIQLLEELELVAPEGVAVTHANEDVATTAAMTRLRDASNETGAVAVDASDLRLVLARVARVDG